MRIVSGEPMDIIKLHRDALTRRLFFQLVEIEANCGLEPYPPQLLMECIEYADTYACMDDEVVAGFITVQPDSRYQGGCIYIVNINVEKHFRRMGVARRMILDACGRYAATHAGQTVMLDVTRTNQPAWNLYHSLGFRETDLPSGNGPSDAVLAIPLEELLSRNQSAG